MGRQVVDREWERERSENVKEEITVLRNSMKCKHVGNKNSSLKHVRLCLTFLTLLLIPFYFLFNLLRIYWNFQVLWKCWTLDSYLVSLGSVLLSLLLTLCTYYSPIFHCKSKNELTRNLTTKDNCQYNMKVFLLPSFYLGSTPP